MSRDLDRQLRDYCEHLDEKQGALSYADILERTGDLQVVRGGERRQPSPWRKWIAAPAAALAILAVLVVAIAIRLIPTVEVIRVVAARADFPASGPIEPGTYHIPSSAWSVAGFTMTMPEGWESQYGAPGAGKVSGRDGEVSFGFVIVDTLYSDPCVGDQEGDNLVTVGPSVDDLADALLAQPHTVSTGPVDTTLGGLPAKRIDLTMADDPETALCSAPAPGNLQIWYQQSTDDYFVLLGDGTASVYILDVNGERQVFLTQHTTGTPAEDIAEMDTIIESITIDSVP